MALAVSPLDLGPFLFHQGLQTPSLTPFTPQTSLSGQTVIMTGANTGLGLDCCHHLIRLHVSHLILACRSLPKAEKARHQLLDAAGLQGLEPKIDVWHLDMADYGSIRAFAERARGLQRLDCVFCNAGIETHEFSLLNGFESTLAVNVVSTLLLGVLMLPQLREEASKLRKDTKLMFTGSMVHCLPDERVLEKAETGKMLGTVTEMARKDMGPIYANSKMLETLGVREMAAREPMGTPNTNKGQGGKVIIAHVNPGWCATELFRNTPHNAFQKGAFRVMGYTSEQGSRALTHAVAVAGRECHGKFLSECRPRRGGRWMEDSSGATGKRFWQELQEIFLEVAPESRGIVAAGP